ncbi:hypothetical protein GQ54DRAFT_116586 [Martensiomyces pterosporus]|nr:hypothetical protein GQ54DRAFT_116586 [Martensiomyces pterosporus]
MEDGVPVKPASTKRMLLISWKLLRRLRANGPLKGHAKASASPIKHAVDRDSRNGGAVAAVAAAAAVWAQAAITNRELLLWNLIGRGYTEHAIRGNTEACSF